MAGHRRAPAGRITVVLVWASIVLVLGTDIAYLLLIRAQGEVRDPASNGVVPFVAGYMFVMAVLVWLSILDRQTLASIRPALRAAAAAGLLVLGVIAAFSIGLPIFVAGVLAAIAAGLALAGPRPWRRALSEVVAAIVAVTLLVAGFEVAQRMITCPAIGTMGGSSVGFVTSGFTWECVNGELHIQSGFCSRGSQSVDANGNVTASSNC